MTVRVLDEIREVAVMVSSAIDALEVGDMLGLEEMLQHASEELDGLIETLERDGVG